MDYRDELRFLSPLLLQPFESVLQPRAIAPIFWDNTRRPGTVTARRWCWPPLAISTLGCGKSLLTGPIAGAKLNIALAKSGRWTLEIVKRSDAVTGFVVLPRRWVVERTFAWPNRNRRLAKDSEATLESSLAWLFFASAKLLMRPLAELYSQTLQYESNS